MCLVFSPTNNFHKTGQERKLTNDMAATDDLTGPPQPKAVKPGKCLRVQLNFMPSGNSLSENSPKPVLPPTPSYC